MCGGNYFLPLIDTMCIMIIHVYAAVYCSQSNFLSVGHFMCSCFYTENSYNKMIPIIPSCLCLCANNMCMIHVHVTQDKHLHYCDTHTHTVTGTTHYLRKRSMSLVSRRTIFSASCSTTCWSSCSWWA